MSGDEPAADHWVGPAGAHGELPPREPAASDVEAPRPSALRIVGRLVLLTIAAIALYGLAPKLIAVFAEVPKLKLVELPWFVVMLLLQGGSYMCAWWLIKVAIPRLPWFVVGTAQLSANAVAKVVPGGAAMGAATQYRMFAAAGVDRGAAATALTAASIISNGVLFTLPMLAVAGSILGVPVPPGLAVVAWGGALLFLLLFGASFVLVRFDRPLRSVGHLVERVSHWVLRRLHRTGGPTAEGFVRQRDQMLGALGSRWKSALAAAVGNWAFDYLALVAALIAVGARPKPSLVLLAYGAAAVLSMIPITPGGLGFVEAGLTATLTLAGVNAEDALLATLAYRIVSYWLPLPAGLVASILFRRRYGNEQATAEAAIQ